MGNFNDGGHCERLSLSPWIGGLVVVCSYGPFWRDGVCVCGAVTDSVTIPEDVFAGIFSLFTRSSREKKMLQLSILSCDAGVSLFVTP